MTETLDVIRGFKDVVQTVQSKHTCRDCGYVILLDGGPPRAARGNENRALERALRVFRGPDTGEEEERRIWYVALTRARRKVYVIVSADTDSHSPFADKLYHNEGGHYDVGEDELTELLEPLRPHVPCPVCKPRGRTTAVLAVLSNAGWKVSTTTVGRLLHELGYRLQSVRKSREGTSHPDRNAQFEHINAKADEFLQRAQPLVSVDTKKKELVGDFKNAGREWQPKGRREKSLVHDFPQDAAGKAIPYGIYDMGCNEAWVSVGCDHDTPTFAVASLRRWWEEMGTRRYPEARELFITADAGGSNGHRSRAWKHELQRFADETGVRVHVSHLPPGTTKWNKIEHRLFCHITQNWRGKPLRTFETIVDLIGNTRTDAGLRVRAELDKRKYPKGVTATDAEMDALSLHRNEFHGDWNYELYPR